MEASFANCPHVDNVENAMRSIVREGLVWHVDRIEALQEELLDGEKNEISNMATVRLREYTAGRTAARKALRSITGQTHSILRASDRRPLWPAKITGSITHTRIFAGCVAARIMDEQEDSSSMKDKARGLFRSIGFDMEACARVSRDIWNFIATESELETLNSLRGTEALESASLIFSAKESYYKALPPGLQKRISTFTDIELNPCETPGILKARSKADTCQTDIFCSFAQNHCITLSLR